MNTNLIVRKPLVLTLAVLALVLAAAVLLIGLLQAAGGDGSLSARDYPTPRVRFDSPLAGHLDGLENATPRVRFAPLGGYRRPAALEGPRKPAALEGRRYPAALEGWRKPAALEGKRTPAALANPFGSQAAPVTLVDGLILLGLVALLLIPVRKASLAHN